MYKKKSVNQNLMPFSNFPPAILSFQTYFSNIKTLFMSRLFNALTACSEVGRNRAEKPSKSPKVPKNLPSHIKNPAKFKLCPPCQVLAAEAAHFAAYPAVAPVAPAFAPAAPALAPVPALVAHPNGAVVPADEPAVVAARADHFAAYGAAAPGTLANLADYLTEDRYGHNQVLNGVANF